MQAPFLSPLGLHEDDVLSVAFSPDGHTLATASSDKTARLWEVAQGLVGRHCCINSRSQHVALHPAVWTVNATWVIAGGWSTLKAWGMRSPRSPASWRSSCIACGATARASAGRRRRSADDELNNEIRRRRMLSLPPGCWPAWRRFSRRSARSSRMLATRAASSPASSGARAVQLVPDPIRHLRHSAHEGRT
jgi:WD domain, G-beta repeat